MNFIPQIHAFEQVSCFTHFLKRTEDGHPVSQLEATRLEELLMFIQEHYPAHFIQLAEIAKEYDELNTQDAHNFDRFWNEWEKTSHPNSQHFESYVNLLRAKGVTLRGHPENFARDIELVAQTIEIGIVHQFKQLATSLGYKVPDDSPVASPLSPELQFFFEVFKWSKRHFLTLIIYGLVKSLYYLEKFPT